MSETDLESEYRRVLLVFRRSALNAITRKVTALREIEELNERLKGTRNRRVRRELSAARTLRKIALRQAERQVAEVTERMRGHEATFLAALRKRDLAEVPAHRRDEANALLDARREAWRKARRTGEREVPGLMEGRVRLQKAIQLLSLRENYPLKAQTAEAELRKIEAEIAPLEVEAERRALLAVADFDERLAALKDS